MWNIIILQYIWHIPYKWNWFNAYEINYIFILDWINLKNVLCDEVNTEHCQVDSIYTFYNVQILCYANKEHVQKVLAKTLRLCYKAL